jgi:hypothetical protein
MKIPTRKTINWKENFFSSFKPINNFFVCECMSGRKMHKSLEEWGGKFMGTQRIGRVSGWVP